MVDKTSSDIPLEVANILIDLRIIAALPENNKLNTARGTYSPVGSKVDSLFRWRHSEDRNNTVSHINSKIDRAIEIGKKHPDWLKIIAESVSDMEKALINLREIYKEDTVKTKLDIIKLRIDKERFLRACNVPKTVEV